MTFNIPFLEESLKLSVLYFSTIHSTSLYCKERIKDLDPFEGVVIASEQTNGQGRVGKTFFSPKDSGLYLTFCFKKELFACDDLTPRIALAVCDSIERIFPVHCGVKWVNDIYVDNKKVSGILCQTFGDYVLIGIGINLLKPNEIPLELRSRLGWVSDVIDENQVTALIQALYYEIVRHRDLDRDLVLQEYCRRCVHLGKDVMLEQDNVTLCGTCTGINENFELLVEIDGEILSFSSGYMTLKI